MKTIFKTGCLAVVVALLTASCCCGPRVADSEFFNQKSNPAIPCYVTEDVSTVILRDYFPLLESVEDVVAVGDGYSVEFLSAGKDTLLLTRAAGAPGVALLEVTLPGGEKGAIVLKQENKTNELPAIATTSFDSDLKGFTFTADGSLPVQYIVLWQNTVLGEEFVSAQQDGIHVSIPANARDFERSFIRVYSFDERGAGNDILVPLADGKVIVDADLLTRHDRQTWTMYQILIDRFYNGNPSNDWRFDDPKVVLPKADYYGGDLAGVDAKLLDGYFDELGINTVWLSPITQNPYTAWGENVDPYTKFSGYHGYWPVYMTKLDDRFGTEEELRKLIADVHADDKNIILDYVANHLHIESPVLQAHPDWQTPMYTPDGRLNLELWDEFRLTTWFDKHIPTLNLEIPEAADPLSDSAVFWMTEYDFDGFRHDATKHIPEIYWRQLTKKLLNRVDRSVFQIGETYGSPALISSYVRSGMLDCQFDFNIYDTFIDATVRDWGTFERLAEVIGQSLQVYGYHNIMGLISGNHDRPRYISVRGGDVSLDENTKYAGWNRNIGVTDSVAYDMLSMLHAMNFTLPGIPIIYTGDEWGQPGANDPDNRRWSQFEPKCEREAQVFKTVQTLAAQRAASMPLLYGDYYELAAERDFLCYMRVYMGECVVVALNKGTDAIQKEIELPFGLELDGAQRVSLEVPAHGYTILNN